MKRIPPLLLVASFACAHNFPIWAAPLIPLTLPISTLQKSKLNSAMNSVKLELIEEKLLFNPQGKPYALALSYRFKLEKNFPAERSVTPECQISSPQLNCDETNFSTIKGQKLNSFNFEQRLAGEYKINYLIYPRGFNLNAQEQAECISQEDLEAAWSIAQTKSSLTEKINTIQSLAQIPNTVELTFYYRLSNKPWQLKLPTQKLNTLISPADWLSNAASTQLKYCKPIL